MKDAKEPKESSTQDILPQSTNPTASGQLGAIHKLACYRLSLVALELFKLSDESDDYKTFIAIKSRELLANLGAGYYGYGFNKKKFYELARASVGKIIGFTVAERHRAERHARAISFLESDVIPAFGALLRKLDKTPNKPAT